MQRWFGLVVSCAVALGACGGEEDDGSSGGSGGAAAGGAAGAGGSAGSAGAGGSAASAGSAGATGGAAGAASACAFQVAKDGRVACAIEPAATAAGISNDFGYHAVGLPASITPSTPVYVHLVGSGGDPAKPATQSFPNQLLMDELTQLGIVVLLPAYDNEPTVGSLCKLDLDCYEPVRREILFGEDAPAPYSALKNVQKPNDVASRLSALVATLSQAGLMGASPPAVLAGGKIDVAKLRIGGHSQGGGHAALFAKQSAVERLCMLSSPIDGSDVGGVGTPVPWVSGTWATDSAKWHAVIHEQDPGFVKAKANFDAMGLVEGSTWTRLTFATTEPHAATVKDPQVAAARAKCIAD